MIIIEGFLGFLYTKWDDSSCCDRSLNLVISSFNRSIGKGLLNAIFHNIDDLAMGLVFSLQNFGFAL